MSERDPQFSEEGPPLAQLLERTRDDLLRFVSQHGRGLLERETAEDLVQGIHLRALEVRSRFAFRGEREFFAWLRALARQHVADRHRYWRALRRRAHHLLRITTTEPEGLPSIAVHPAAPGAGPVTSAARQDEITFALEVFPRLFPRDRGLLEAVAEGLTLAETAARFGLSEDAARKARRRAIERFRLAVEALRRGR